MHQLSRLGRKRKAAAVFRELPMLKDSQGCVLESMQEQQNAWFNQFSHIEAAVAVSEEEWARAHCGKKGASHDVSLQELPSLSLVQQKIRRLKGGKAAGLDAIPNEVIRAGGPVMRAMLHELILNVAAHGREPLQWKSGVAVPLYKKGVVTEPANYRAFFLSDSIAKLSHSCLRNQLNLTHEEIAHSACFGATTAEACGFCLFRFNCSIL